jgi:hypothetical protein
MFRGRACPAAVIVCLTIVTGTLSAQAAVAMRARLAPVPIDVAMQAIIAGLGEATGTLSASTLTVEGTYRGLVSPATSVRIYESARMGMRGTLVGELASGGATSGTFKGTVTLSREQAAAFGKGLLYVQLQSEKAPDGNLWGWLTPSKGRR